MYRYRRRRSTGYLIPFLTLISIGIVLVMAFQIWGALFATAKGDAVFYSVEGRSKLLPYGQTEWEYANSGVKVKLGDSIKTLNGARGLISFYDGTLVRIDQDTEINLMDITKNGDNQQILLTLNKGQIWVNKPKQKLIKKTDFMITTDYATYAITGTIFDLEKQLQSETLRVLKGEVDIDIIKNDAGKKIVVSTVTVGIGQESYLDEAVISSFLNLETPSVKRAISTEFMNSSWYLWNTGEDDKPTDFSKGSALALPDNSETVVDDTAETVEVEKSALAAPKIVEPKDSSISSEDDQFEVKGTVEKGVKKVVVKQSVAGSTEPEKILISGFNEEEGTFSYFISLSRDNIKSGKNHYEFMGVDEKALETVSAVLDIDYIGKAETSEVDVLNNQSDLSTPVALTIDGNSYKEGMKVENNTFQIIGKVSGAEKMFVDDYQLSKFKAGDANWSYNVSTKYGNLIEGKNVFKVYAEDVSSKKSEIANITIEFTGKVEKVVVTETPTAPTENSSTDVATPVVTNPTTEPTTTPSESTKPPVTEAPATETTTSTTTAPATVSAPYSF